MGILKHIDHLILTESFTFAIPESIAELNNQLIKLNDVVRDYFRNVNYDFNSEIPSKESIDEFVKSLRIQNIINSSPELLKESVRNFFKTYDQDPNVIKLIELSETNPNQFISILIATAAIFTSLLVGGGLYFYKKIRQYQISSAELNTAQKFLETAKTDKDKKESIKQIALIGAKHLIFQKFNKV